MSPRDEGKDAPRRIINTWDQMRSAGGDQVAICYRPRGDGRSMQTEAWQVLHLVNGVQQVTDRRAAWYDHGEKTFLLFGDGATWRERKQAAFNKAVAWVTATYGARTFVRNAMGDFVEAETQRRFPIKRQRRKQP